jgi:hypothetical protein
MSGSTEARGTSEAPVVDVTSVEPDKDTIDPGTDGTELVMPTGGTDSGQAAEKPKKPSEGILRFLGSFFATTWIFWVIGLVWLYNADISSGLRLFIVIAVPALIVLGVLTAGAWAFRSRPGVRKAIASLLLIGLVILTALAPVVFLAESDRILLLKLGAIAFLALFPGLLYVQFVSTKAETLRDEYVLNLHRLRVDSYGNLPPPPEGSLFRRDDDERTLDDEDVQRNLYLQKFDAIYGVRVLHKVANEEDVVVRKNSTSLLPIGMCTVLFAVGWALTLQPEPISTDSLLASITLSGRPILPTDALRFGFLGAYMFIIEMLTRRYFQDDLKTGAYLSGATRILSTTILIAALHQVWPDSLSASQEVAFAFIIGVFPTVGLQAIQSLIAIPLRQLVRSLRKEHPLSDLDGLNIWYESRLVEEGIEDMQNLATANIVDVMLRTRVPVDRLVDWIDQAVFDLHVRDGKGEESDRLRLRRLGIRTATDLEDALLPGDETVSNGSAPTPSEPQDFVGKMESVLNREDEKLPSITFSIWKTLAREPNLYHVRQWKQTTKRLGQRWTTESSTQGFKSQDEGVITGATAELVR